jgi:hypothetical protein
MNIHTQTHTHTFSNSKHVSDWATDIDCEFDIKESDRFKASINALGGTLNSTKRIVNGAYALAHPPKKDTLKTLRKAVKAIEGTLPTRIIIIAKHSTKYETLARSDPNTMIIYHIPTGTNILDIPPMWNKKIHGVKMRSDDYIMTMTQNKQAAHLDPIELAEFDKDLKEVFPPSTKFKGKWWGKTHPWNINNFQMNANKPLKKRTHTKYRPHCYKRYTDMEYALQWAIPNFPHYDMNGELLKNIVGHNKMAGIIGILPSDIKQTLKKINIEVNAEILTKIQGIIISTAKDIFRIWEMRKKAWEDLLPIPS